MPAAFLWLTPFRGFNAYGVSMADAVLCLRRLTSLRAAPFNGFAVSVFQWPRRFWGYAIKTILKQTLNNAETISNHFKQLQTTPND